MALLASLTACSGSEGLSGPLTALSTCGPPPAAADVELPDGLVLPEESVVTGTTVNGPLTQVRGYAGRTPVEVRAHYEALAGVDVLQAEDEVFEAELLVSDGDHRTYVKAVAVCAQGSTLDVLVAPESAAGAVPTPSGSP